MKGKKQRAARNDVQNLRPLGIKHPRASIQKRIFRLIDHAVASPHCQAIEWRCNLNIDIQRLRSQSTDDQLVLSSVAYIAQEVLFPHNKGMLPHAARCAANQKKTSFKFKRMNENLPPGVPDCAPSKVQAQSANESSRNSHRGDKISASASLRQTHVSDKAFGETTL